ncbi:MAG: L-glutamate gamma-semialdehyde dehydrogenase [Deltaproteobacteria bacterium]|nr:L-glutamate gamma-semialdehyde dehydrogenase [Deltaproteobacteria bacterium]
MLVHNARINVPPPRNEPVLSHAPGSPEKQALKAALARMAKERLEIPLWIGGRHVRTGRLADVRMPHAHDHILATYHEAGPEEVQLAVRAAKEAWHDWARMPWESRAAIFLRAAELLATKYRPILNAATMLGQSKTAFQAEIDSACELIDFWRFNVDYAARLYAEQPQSAPGTWNALELRPLEGFVLAVTPFNFTAIAGNLPTAPAIMGNTVVWKPAAAALYSAWFIVQILEEAGLPEGVINMVAGPPGPISEVALGHPDLAGVHFTGSTEVFQWMWRTVGEKIASYKTYPRLVGETGGKDFIVAHPSADPDALVAAIVRGGFEYQGQKCSAASRLYLAQSTWEKIHSKLIDTISSIRVGDVVDFRNFMGAVIDSRAYARLEGSIASARNDGRVRIVAGGKCDRSSGWFIHPTLIRAEDPFHSLMATELFGPVVTQFVYPDGDYERILKTCNETSPYALTGSIFANDRRAIAQASDALRHAAGNFYVNDKPTGAVVGQQPFGGARASGTNDKAGSPLNLMRWVSARTVKETLSPPTSYTYPFMLEE